MRLVSPARAVAFAMLIAGMAGAAVPRATRRVHDDPARILLRAGKLDVLRIHGAITPATPIDPAAEGLTVALRNVDGVLYRAAVLPGDFHGKRRLTFLDRSASAGGLRDGLYKVSLLREGRRYHFGVQAYADLARATRAEMTLRIDIGDDAFVNEAAWRRTRGGWKLTF